MESAPPAAETEADTDVEVDAEPEVEVEAEGGGSESGGEEGREFLVLAGLANDSAVSLLTGCWCEGG